MTTEPTTIPFLRLERKSGDVPRLELIGLGGTKLSNCYWKYEYLIRIRRSITPPSLFKLCDILQSCGLMAIGQTIDINFKQEGAYVITEPTPEPSTETPAFDEYLITVSVDSSD